jgi:C1A family cysteine protease
MYSSEVLFRSLKVSTLLFGTLLALTARSQVSELKINPAAIATEEARASFYAERLKSAPPVIKARLDALTAEHREKLVGFKIGYTTAMDFSLEQLAGTKIPAEVLKSAPQQNKIAAEALKMDAADAARFHIPRPVLACSASTGSFDWRARGKVTAVRNQGGCGSCWDFAAMAAFESAYLIRNSVTIDASEQHVLDCAGAGTCGGGWYGPVWGWMMNHKVADEAHLPYAGVDQACPAALVGSYQDVTWGFVTTGNAIPTVEQIKQALCEHGALAVAMEATPLFQAYTGGVFNEPNVTGINHAVTIVGWDDANQAWIVKNSWSTGWGEAGYFRIRYGSNSIGYAAAWVEAASTRYKINPQIFKLRPEHLPIADIDKVPAPG